MTKPKQPESQMPNFQIFTAAAAAAQAAAEAHEKTLPPENKRGLDCGFAWVDIKPARGPFITWCRKNAKGERKDYGGGGWQIWSSVFQNIPTQSVSTKYAAAEAFAQVLRDSNINAFAGSRLD